MNRSLIDGAFASLFVDSPQPDSRPAPPNRNSLGRLRKDRRVQSIERKDGFYWIQLRAGYRNLGSGTHCFTASSLSELSAALEHSIRLCACSSCREAVRTA